MTGRERRSIDRSAVACAAARVDALRVLRDELRDARRSLGNARASRAEGLAEGDVVDYYAERVRLLELVCDALVVELVAVGAGAPRVRTG